MKAIALDTLEFVKRLRAANFTEAQAEAMVEAIAAVVTEQLATKGDIAELRRELGAEIESVRRELGAEIESVRREIKESEYRLTIRLGGMLAAAVAVVAALVKLL